MTQANIVRMGQPSRTAWHVAQVRAVHQLLDEPLVLDDPLALPILGAEAEAALRDDPFQFNDMMSRGLRAALVVRSRFAEDEAARAVADGVRQLVVLGAGLDTFSCRHGHDAADLRLFEVDHPATQGMKRQLLAQAGITLPDGLCFVAADFEHLSLGQMLADHGFDQTLPACFSWLGVSMYLSEATVMETLAYVATLAAGSSICFDFRLTEGLMNPVERVISHVVAKRCAEMGEPWLSAFDPQDLCAKVRALGFSQVQALGPEELNQRYLYRRKDGLHTRSNLLWAKV